MNEFRSLEDRAGLKVYVYEPQVVDGDGSHPSG